MMNRSSLTVLSVLIVAVSTAYVPVAAAGPLKVFVLAGQSNMEGHAQVRTFDYIGRDPATAPLCPVRSSLRLSVDAPVSFKSQNARGRALAGICLLTCTAKSCFKSLNERFSPRPVPSCLAARRSRGLEY